MLLRAGCEPEELRLLESSFAESEEGSDSSVGRLEQLAEFATAIGPRASRDYFRALAVTHAVAELTDPKVLAFARSVDPHTAEWYFWAVWGTGAVSELTADRVLDSAEFFRSMDGPAVVEYFLAIRETGAARELTTESVFTASEAIGSDAAVELFGACWETQAVPALTDERVLDFARSLGGEAAKEYFVAIRETKRVVDLTDRDLREFALAIGPAAAREYFRAVRVTRAVSSLTDPHVRAFAESLGKASARLFFRVVASTGAVQPLTDPSLLAMSGVIRSIGADAALDYFIAAAAAPELSAPVLPSPVAMRAGKGSTVPVLTLFDLPTYTGYRAAGLLGVTAVFWWSVWRFAALTVPGTPGALDLATSLLAWVALMSAAYLLLGKMADRSAEQFLSRRRRLLNEHGIRWHDCHAANPRCPVCWAEGPTHRNSEFDFERFCRCPAC